MTGQGQSRQYYSAFAPTARTTLPKRSVSDAMNAANSAGVVATASAPCSVICLTTFGSRSARTKAALSLSMTASEVPTGATRPNQTSRADPGKARFRHRRGIRQHGQTLRRRHRDGAHLARLEKRQQRRVGDEEEVDSAGRKIDSGRSGAAVGNVHHVCPGPQLQHLAEQMSAGAGAL